MCFCLLYVLVVCWLVWLCCCGGVCAVVLCRVSGGGLCYRVPVCLVCACCSFSVCKCCFVCCCCFDVFKCVFVCVVALFWGGFDVVKLIIDCCWFAVLFALFCVMCAVVGYVSFLCAPVGDVFSRCFVDVVLCRVCVLCWVCSVMVCVCRWRACVVRWLCACVLICRCVVCLCSFVCCLFRYVCWFGVVYCSVLYELLLVVGVVLCRVLMCVLVCVYLFVRVFSWVFMLFVFGNVWSCAYFVMRC